MGAQESDKPSGYDIKTPTATAKKLLGLKLPVALNILVTIFLDNLNNEHVNSAAQHKLDLCLTLLDWLMAGGENPLITLAHIRQTYPADVKCEEVWTDDHIAYRCKTCGISESSCMCVKCFDPEDHIGHDYRMYRSSSGGCCDCGDPLAWDPKGFCKKHRRNRTGDGAANDFKELSPNIRQGATLAVRAAVYYLVYLVENIGKYHDELARKRNRPSLLSQYSSDQSRTNTFLGDSFTSPSRNISAAAATSSFEESKDTPLSDSNITPRRMREEMQNQSLLVQKVVLWLQKSCELCCALRHLVCNVFQEPRVLRLGSGFGGSGNVSTCFEAYNPVPSRVLQSVSQSSTDRRTSPSLLFQQKLRFTSDSGFGDFDPASDSSNSCYSPIEARRQETKSNTFSTVSKEFKVIDEDTKTSMNETIVAQNMKNAEDNLRYTFSGISNSNESNSSKKDRKRQRKIEPPVITLLDGLMASGLLLPGEQQDDLGVLYLKLLFDSRFKEFYTECFVRHYARLLDYLVQPSDPEVSKGLSRFLDRIFCQLFHNPQQVLRLVKRKRLVSGLLRKVVFLFLQTTSKGQSRKISLGIGEGLGRGYFGNRARSDRCRRNRIKNVKQMKETASNPSDTSLTRTFSSSPVDGVSTPSGKRKRKVCDIEGTSSCEDVDTDLSSLRLVAGCGPVDCSHSLVKDNIYSRMVADLRTVLSHQIVSSYVLFASDHSPVTKSLLQLLSLMEDMNPQVRQLEEHVEYDDAVWQSAFILSHEMMLLCGTVVDGYRTRLADRSMLDELRSTETAARFLLQCGEALKQHISDANDKAPCTQRGRFFRVSKHKTSFHLPLHRFTAWMLHESLAVLPGASLTELLPLSCFSRDMLRSLVSRPLRVQVLVRQVQAGMWVRNGDAMWSEVAYYYSRYWHDTGLDLDVMLLQVLFVMLGGKELIPLMARSFESENFLQLDPPVEKTENNSNGIPQRNATEMPSLLSIDSERLDGEDFNSSYDSEIVAASVNAAERGDLGLFNVSGDNHPVDVTSNATTESNILEPPEEWDAYMTEELLSMIIILASDRRRSGLTPKAAVEKEVLHILATGKMSHSQLSSRVASRLTALDAFEDSIKKSSSFIEPGMVAGRMESGHYRLKPEAWREVNPYFLHYSRLDRQQMEQQYQQHIQRTRPRYTSRSESMSGGPSLVANDSSNASSHGFLSRSRERSNSIFGSGSTQLLPVQIMVDTFPALKTLPWQVLWNAPLHGIIFCVLQNALWGSKRSSDGCVSAALYVLALALQLNDSEWSDEEMENGLVPNYYENKSNSVSVNKEGGTPILSMPTDESFQMDIDHEENNDASSSTSDYMDYSSVRCTSNSPESKDEEEGRGHYSVPATMFEEFFTVQGGRIPKFCIHTICYPTSNPFTNVWHPIDIPNVGTKTEDTDTKPEISRNIGEILSIMLGTESFSEQHEYIESIFQLLHEHSPDSAAKVDILRKKQAVADEGKGTAESNSEMRRRMSSDRQAAAIDAMKKKQEQFSNFMDLYDISTSSSGEEDSNMSGEEKCSDQEAVNNTSQYGSPSTSENLENLVGTRNDTMDTSSSTVVVNGGTWKPTLRSQRRRRLSSTDMDLDVQDNKQLAKQQQKTALAHIDAAEKDAREKICGESLPRMKDTMSSPVLGATQPRIRGRAQSCVECVLCRKKGVVGSTAAGLNPFALVAFVQPSRMLHNGVAAWREPEACPSHSYQGDDENCMAEITESKTEYTTTYAGNSIGEKQYCSWMSKREELRGGISAMRRCAAANVLSEKCFGGGSHNISELALARMNASQKKQAQMEATQALLPSNCSVMDKSGLIARLAIANEELAEADAKLKQLLKESSEDASLEGDDEQSLSVKDTDGVVNVGCSSNEINACYRNMLCSDITSGGSSTSKQNKSAHVQSCGHFIHTQCFESYYLSLQERHIQRQTFEGHLVVNIDDHEFLCPICRRLGNSLIPLLPNIPSSSTSGTEFNDTKIKTVSISQAMTGHCPKSSPVVSESKRMSFSGENESRRLSERIALGLVSTSIPREMPGATGIPANNNSSILEENSELSNRHNLALWVAGYVWGEEVSQISEKCTQRPFGNPLLTNLLNFGQLLLEAQHGSNALLSRSPLRIFLLNMSNTIATNVAMDEFALRPKCVSSLPERRKTTMWHLAQCIYALSLYRSGNQPRVSRMPIVPDFVTNAFVHISTHVLPRKLKGIKTCNLRSSNDVQSVLSLDLFPVLTRWLFGSAATLRVPFSGLGTAASKMVDLFYPAAVMQALFCICVCRARSGLPGPFCEDTHQSILGNPPKPPNDPGNPPTTLLEAYIWIWREMHRKRDDGSCPLDDTISNVVLPKSVVQLCCNSLFPKETTVGVENELKCIVNELILSLLRKLSLLMTALGTIGQDMSTINLSMPLKNEEKMDETSSTHDPTNSIHRRNVQAELNVLCAHLQLRDVQFCFTAKAPNSKNHLNVVRNHRSLIGVWMSQMQNALRGSATPIQALLPSFNLSEPFQLIPLPKIYARIYLDNREKKCIVCNKVPQMAALCLVCGRLLCWLSKCCLVDGCGEVTRHSDCCGAGSGCFLLLRESLVLLTMGRRRRCMWGSLYLDEHGEEDRNLRRGKPLYLSASRLEQLRQLMVWNSFGQSTRVLSMTRQHNGMLY